MAKSISQFTSAISGRITQAPPNAYFKSGQGEQDYKPCGGCGKTFNHKGCVVCPFCKRIDG